MAEIEARQLERLEERLSALRRRSGRLATRVEIVSRENRDLAHHVSGLAGKAAGAPLDGLVVGTVGGDEADGEPVPTDAQGRVPVLLNINGQDKKLTARIATPWNIKGGGATFLPRKGQTVYLAFEDGTPELPVLVGYAPNPNTPLDYSPTSQAPAPTLALTMDASGNAYNPPSSNAHKSIIRSTSPGQSGKTSEITLSDQTGQEGISMGTGGRMRIQSRGDHYRMVEGDTVDHHVGDHVQNIGGSYTKTIDQDFKRTVGGDFNSNITGNKSHVVSGDYHLDVQGQYSMEVAAGRSVHEIWKAKDAIDIYLAGRNNLVLGESGEAHEDLRINIFFPMVFDFAVQHFDASPIKMAFWLYNASSAAADKREQIAAMDNALAAMKEHVVKTTEDAIGSEEPAAAIEAYGMKLCTGLKVNAP